MTTLTPEQQALLRLLEYLKEEVLLGRRRIGGTLETRGEAVVVRVEVA